MKIQPKVFLIDLHKTIMISCASCSLYPRVKNVFSYLWNTVCFLCLQDIESENVNVVKRLFKIQNVNASTIRTVMVAHCRRHDTPDLLLDYEAQSQQQRKGESQHHQPLLFNLGASDSEEDDDERDTEGGEHAETRHCAHLPHLSPSRLEHVRHVRMELFKCPSSGVSGRNTDANI